MRLALWGDGQSPHLLKWARALAPQVELWAASSRGFSDEFEACVPAARRLALQTQPHFEGGNAALLLQLPRLANWLKQVQPHWVHAHYLSSHGTLAWLAQSLLGTPGRLVGSAWGSDILVAPQRSRLMRWATTRVLRACALSTSDSEHMAQRMRSLGAGEVMVFPFGLEAMPDEASQGKEEWLFFANRGLEPIYQPLRVLDTFAALTVALPQARLVVANDGSMRKSMEARAQAHELGERVLFVGRLAPQEQAGWYGRARWYLSLPQSDSVSVSVLEAMAHGCVPLLADLPANHELVTDGVNGLILSDLGSTALPERLQALGLQAEGIAQLNRKWVRAHALFPQAVQAFVQRLYALSPGGLGAV